jgi:MYXO-CTERM domain-containing protein
VREAGVRPDEPRDAAAKPTGTRSPDRQPADADVPVLADEDASTPRRRAAAGCSCRSVDDHALRGLHTPGLAFALLVLGTRHRKRRTAMVAREESP